MKPALQVMRRRVRGPRSPLLIIDTPKKNDCAGDRPARGVVELAERQRQGEGVTEAEAQHGTLAVPY